MFLKVYCGMFPESSNVPESCSQSVSGTWAGEGGSPAQSVAKRRESPKEEEENERENNPAN